MDILGYDVTNVFMQLIIALSLTTVYVLIQIKLFQKSRLNEPNNKTGSEVPGPKPSDPVNGNFPDIIRAGSLPQYLKAVHAQYGDVVQIWFGQNPVVSTASPWVFKEQIRLFDKPEMSFLAPVFGDQSIQFMNGEEAKQRRRNYDVFLNKDSVEGYFEIFKQVAEEMVEELKVRQDSDHVNIYNVMFHMTCKSVGIALFGEYFKDNLNIKNFKTLYDEFWPVLEKNFTSGHKEKNICGGHYKRGNSYDEQQQQQQPDNTTTNYGETQHSDVNNRTNHKTRRFIRCKNRQAWKQSKKRMAKIQRGKKTVLNLSNRTLSETEYILLVVAEVHGVVKDIIAQHKQNTHARKFIDVVMETGLDETTVYGDILVYLVGGFHSVSTTLTWCMYHAVIYPEMQTRITEEVTQNLANNELTHQNVFKLRYLRDFIDETLRLRFVAPVATRLAGENTIIAGYKIPQGTHIIQALCVVLTSDCIWTKPDEFKPQRFDSTRTNQELEISKKRSPLTFCPFGFAGKRMCPGKQFFYSEAMLILGTLFKNFKFELSEETPKDIPVIYGLLTRPAVDVFLKMSRVV